MKVGVIGCRFNTYRFISQLKKDKIPINCIITKEFKKNLNKKSEYCDLTPLAKSANIKIIKSKNYQLDEKTIKKIYKENLDIILCVGWQRILSDKVLEASKLGVLGMHGSQYLLPKGRGRSPQVWTIIMGSKFYYAHIFKYNSEIDSGEILYVKKLDVTPFDSAADLQIKSQIVFNQFLKKNFKKIKTFIKKSKKQIHRKGSYFKKRNAEDGIINWNIKVNKIFDFVRAQTSPYPGTYSFIGKRKYKIWSCHKFDTKINYKVANGTIVDILNTSEILVQCKGGILRVTNFEPKNVKIGMRFLNKKS